MVFTKTFNFCKYRLRDLENNKAIFNYNINKGDTLHLDLTLGGGTGKCQYLLKHSMVILFHYLLIRIIQYEMLNV